jgi:CHAD domain-containing protein
MADKTKVTKQPNTLYRLRIDEPLPVGIKRIALEQVDRAIWQLTTPRKDYDNAVHDARKCCKKTRAVLRLVRDEIGRDVYRRENALYRDAARELSALRSSAVMAETLDAMCERFSDELPSGAFSTTREGLMAKHRQALRTAVKKGTLLTDVAEDMRKDRDRLLHLPLETEDFSTLRQGLRRVYRRGRRAMHISKGEPTTANLHEWRKRVKYLRYQARILNPLEPVIIQALAADTDTLSDLLGLDHDLSELIIVVQTTPQLTASKKELRSLLALIDRFRPELQADAFTLGARIYEEKPRAFVDRLEGYWQAMVG